MNSKTWSKLLFTDTYDVQSVNGRPIAGGLELSCTFAEGSQAQSCILTICNGTYLEICRNISISREDPQTSGRLKGLDPGLYTIRKVAEVESDGQVTVHRRIVVLELQITESVTTLGSFIIYNINFMLLMIMSKNISVLQKPHQLTESHGLLHKILNQ